VKPGAILEEIISPPRYTTTKLMKKDVVVMWGGTRDIGRNEANKALHQISKFVQSHNQTNVIVMSAPHRYNLDPNSCVNKEVTVFNRKLRKYLKTCDNAMVLDVDPPRELYTRHSLHMNKNGKEQMAKKNCIGS
jgi:translation initiation factor 2 gamma subunit (eIF-2gamma)